MSKNEILFDLCISNWQQNIRNYEIKPKKKSAEQQLKKKKKKENMD